MSTLLSLESGRDRELSAGPDAVSRPPRGQTATGVRGAGRLIGADGPTAFSGCLGLPGRSLVVESCCPGILVSNYRFLPVMIGQSGVAAGGWGWDAELRGDLSPRHTRRERLGHRPGEEIVGPVATGDGSLAVRVHRNARPGPLDGRELIDPSP